MEMTIDQVDDVAVVLLAERDLDAASAEKFKAGIAPVLKAQTKVVLDLSRLRFIDSSGLGAFLSCLRQLAAKGGELKVCGLSNSVYQTFELVRMNRVFDIYASRREAVEAFRP